MSLSLRAVIAEKLEQKTSAVPNQSELPKQCILQCMGEPSAQVALLQSPILSVAKTSYSKTKTFPWLPVDKPHTRVSAVIFRDLSRSQASLQLRPVARLRDR